MSDEKPQDPPKGKQGWTGAEAAELAREAAKAAETRLAAAKATVEAAAKEYEAAVEIAAKAAVEAEKEFEATAKAAMAKSEAVKAANESLTNKRNQERIFRREMGEPEFFHTKKDLVPTRPILTDEEQEEISRKVEIPVDQVPVYRPKHILSPEFGGASNYESGVSQLVAETRQKLDRLRSDPNATAEEIIRAEQDLKYLDSLHENFYFGMNVFRTAKGGRDKLRE
ncbi:MAG: hypothetical protein EPO63_07605 [Candidatus Nitrosotenuis sp.]|nr:MAG: hypothetical protein EPO63_07605 [Candidatus Nitrosotenuis sp.]